MNEYTPRPQAVGSPDVLLRVLETLEVGIAFYDRDGKLVFANSTMLEALDCPTGTRIEQEVNRLVTSCARIVRERGLANRPDVVELESALVSGEPCFQLRGRYFGYRLFGREGLVLVTLRRCGLPADAPGAPEARLGLTRRELRIASLLSEGKSNAEIAAELHISPSTARNHTKHILQKLGVRSRAQVGALFRSREQNDRF